MGNYEYTQEMMDQNPSLCHNCDNARKPASESLAQEGYVGCAMHFSLARQEGGDMESALWKIIKGAQLDKAVTGWVTPLRLNTKARESSAFNCVLMTKHCTKCRFFKLRSHE